jgi:hypothetical protein
MEYPYDGVSLTLLTHIGDTSYRCVTNYPLLLWDHCHGIIIIMGIEWETIKSNNVIIFSAMELAVVSFQVCRDIFVVIE